jgi:chromosome segregation ATPase
MKQAEKDLHNAQIKSDVAWIEQQRAVQQANHDNLTKDADTLKTARDKLQKEMDLIMSFETSTLENFKKSIDKSNFKGDRRDKFEKNVGQMKDAIHAEWKKHNDNKAEIDAKITQLEGDAGDVWQTIVSFGNQIHDLWDSWFS